MATEVQDDFLEPRVEARHGAEQYAGDLECVFYGYHLDRAILKNTEAAYCLMPSLVEARLHGLTGEETQESMAM